MKDTGDTQMNTNEAARAARAIVNVAMSEYHHQPVDCWAAKDGPGAFAEIMARLIAKALDVARNEEAAAHADCCVGREDLARLTRERDALRAYVEEMAGLDCDRYTKHFLAPQKRCSCFSCHARALLPSEPVS